MFSLHGVGVGGGIVIARARRLEASERDVPRYRVLPTQVERELTRMETAIEVVRAELQAIAEQLPEEGPAEARALLDVHAMILDDPALAEAARQTVREDLRNAEWAFAAQAAQLAAQFDEIDDAYLRERSRDVLQVADRVTRVLSGSRARVHFGGDEPCIFVAEDLSPADMLSLRSAVGFAIDQGGATSHTAILARGMDVPAVVGAGLASRLIADDDWLVLDGEQGVVIVAPDEGVLSQYRRLQALSLREREALQKLLHVPAVTRDGTKIRLLANVERPEEAGAALEAGAEGIGLFRSEFLFLNRRDLPGEDEQFEAYREAVVAMQGGAAPIPQNPALGRRAIRYCLSQPPMFLVQLRAILRASAHGTVRLLIPMLAHGHEIEQTLRLIGIAKTQLRERNLDFDDTMPVGGMVEIPAAALSASLFVRRLDFLSIGTNDLTQYTLAIDRSDHEVASLYEPFHPAVLRLVAMTIRAARRAGKPVAVCGEMAGDWGATQLLLGMGLREFSMHPASLLRVKREILRADVTKLAPRVTRLLQAVDPLRMRAQLARLVAA